MNGKRSLRSEIGIFLAAVGLFLFPSLGWAEEFDITCCGSLNVTILSADQELRITGAEGKGISRSNHPNKIFDGSTWQVVSVSKVIGGTAQWIEYRKYQDMDGDIFYVEIFGGAEGTLKFLDGTGKYKGITGEAKTTAVVRGKPIVPGTAQYCGRAIGSFTLKK